MLPASHIILPDARGSQTEFLVTTLGLPNPAELQVVCYEEQFGCNRIPGGTRALGFALEEANCLSGPGSMASADQVTPGLLNISTHVSDKHRNSLFAKPWLLRDCTSERQLPRKETSKECNRLSTRR